MKRTEFALVALKVLGLFWFVQACAYFLRGGSMPFAGIARMTGDFNWKVEVGTMFLFGGLYLAASLLLLIRTETLLRIIKIDNTDDASGEQSTSSHSYRPLAFLVLGLYFAVPALGKIIHDLIKLTSLSKDMSAPTYQMFQQTFLWEVLPGLGENTIKLILGCALVAVSLKPEKMKMLWRKLRPLSDNENEKRRE